MHMAGFSGSQHRQQLVIVVVVSFSEPQDKCMHCIAYHEHVLVRS